MKMTQRLVLAFIPKKILKTSMTDNPIHSFIKTIADIDSEVVFATKAAPKNDVEGLFFNMLMSLSLIHI